MKRSLPTLTVAVAAAFAAAACTKEHQPERTQTTSAEVPTDQGMAAEARGKQMKSATGFVQNIEQLTTDNRDFRRVLYTAPHCQLVVMAIPPGDHIGREVHDVDQFLRVEEGTGEVVIDDTRTAIGDGSAIIIPAGRQHDVVNKGATPLKLYTIYSPPHHRDGVVHRTRADAEKDKEHFDGQTTK